MTSGRGHFPKALCSVGCGTCRIIAFIQLKKRQLLRVAAAFNIKAKSLRLGNFSRTEIATLYLQHTDETGQRFEPDALDLIWTLTNGQPWLINALAYEVCFEMTAGRNRSTPITTEMVTEAKEQIVLRRETHIDQLMDKLTEARVRRVIEPMLSGMGNPNLIPTDDILYVQDLGLIRPEAGQLSITNQIYREIIPRELTYSTQLTIPHQPAWYIRADNRLDLPKLLFAFQEFFREHSESWMERFDYKEAGAQLLMQAFLQRIVNSGGRVEREYGLGHLRTDLLVIWPHPGGLQKAVIELKILYGSLERTLEKGLEQTWAYMDRCGTDEGYLVIFDRDSQVAWADKIFNTEETYQGKMIKIWGM